MMPEYVQAADAIVDSEIDYSLIRCAALTDEDDIVYHITQEGESIRNESVTRKAVARFIADIITGKYPIESNSSFGITA